MEPSTRRGRPRKDKSSQSSEKYRCSYWLDEVFIDHGGYAWATELVEKAPIDGRRCWAALPICLGREDDLVPILKSEKPVPQDMHPRQKEVLLRIVEDISNNKVRSTRSYAGTQRFSVSKRAGRSFRGDYRYRA